MKIFIKQIPEQGLIFNKSVSAKDLDIPEDIMACLTPLMIRAKFERAGDEVLAAVEVDGAYRLACSRCLEEFELTKTDCFELVFDVEPAMEFIEIDNDIREELIVAMSSNPQCRVACKGLCKDCGANLNLEKCKCKRD